MPWKRGIRMDRRRLEVILCLALGVPLTAFSVASRIPYPVEKLAPKAALAFTDPAWVPLDRVAPVVIQATLAGEDHRFHEHRGVDGLAMIRALWLAISHGRPISGGSTITMQLIRLVEPHPKTLRGKVNEMVDACRLERTVSKAEILEQYLNRAYYGNGAWGIEAAAQRYFGKPAADLTAGEGTFLAVLPRAPLGYDPYRHRAEALERRSQVLALMEKRGWLNGVGRAAAESQSLVFFPRKRPPELSWRWPSGMPGPLVDLDGPPARCVLDDGSRRAPSAGRQGPA
jgi:penicillin-binding protein 1C